MGDPSRPFAGRMSPWARLLDHLAYRIGVRERRQRPRRVVSPCVSELGRIRGRVIGCAGAGAVRGRGRAKVNPHAAVAGRGNERPYDWRSPSRPVPPGLPVASGMDAIGSSDLPNLSSALGLGYRKVIKPDLLADGGREYVRSSSTNPHLHVEPARPVAPSALMAAAPDPRGDLSRTALTWGTSAATALTTRAAHLVFDADKDGGSMLADTPPQYIPLIVKALLVHGSAWGDRATVLDELSDAQHYGKRQR